MGLHMELGVDRPLHVTVSGNFDFDLSRDVLLGVKAQWRAGVTDILIVLRGVTRTTSCSIDTLALLAEMAGENLAIQTVHCDEKVHALFSSGLLDRYFPSAPLAGCHNCPTLRKAPTLCPIAHAAPTVSSPGCDRFTKNRKKV